MNIAIIGAGLAGSNILKNLFDNNFIEGNNIYVFEKRKDLGPGFPYEKESEYKYLNVDKKYMSMSEDEDGFIKWLNSNIDNPEGFEEMVPRNYYGEYLKDFYKKYYDHENINIVHKEVVDIEILDNDNYKIKTNNWEDICFDAIFLSIGHPDYKDFYDLKDKDNYIHNPYPMDEKLSNLPYDKKIGIMGAGATSLDIFRYILQEYNLKYPLYILARSSIFNIPHIELENQNYKFSMSNEWIEEQLKENSGFIPLDNILHLIDSDFKSVGVDFIDCYNRVKDIDLELYKELLEEKPQDIALVIDYFEVFTKYFAKLYGYLSNNDIDRLMSKYSTMLDSFKTLTPPKTIEWILESIEENKMKIIMGLEDIKYKNNKFEVSADENVEMDVLINTTGFDFNIKRNTKTNELINNLYNKKIIDPDMNGDFINVRWPECRMLSKKYGEIKNLYAIGMWIFGTQYRANDARSIKYVSKDLVKKFVENNK